MRLTVAESTTRPVTAVSTAFDDVGGDNHLNLELDLGHR